MRKDTIEMDTTETDDPIVKEIPVFLSKALANNLYVIQYPAYMKDGCTNSTFLRTSIKPENQKIQVEFGIDTTNNQFYDYNTGQRMALNINKKTAGNDERLCNSDLMDRIALTSEPTLSDCSNFAIGIFQDNELHFTPLKAMLHMKLQCDYLDESDKSIKDRTKSTGEDDDEDEDNATPVKVTFARHIPDNVKKLQEQSFRHHNKKNQEEPWIHTNYIPSYDIQAESTRIEMFCPSIDESINNLNLAQKNYLHLLVPQLPDECYLHSTSEDHINIHRIMTLPLLDQIKIIMKQVKIISFTKLCEILSEHDIIMILKYLQQVAMLVQGNWVVNSELVYPKDSFSFQKEEKVYDIMSKARDYILLSFTEQQFLNRNTILSIFKLMPEEINKIFAEFGIYEAEKGWRLKEPPNWSFCNSHRYSEIIQRQKILWDAKRKHIRETMEAQNQLPQRQRRKSNRESLGSENEEKNIGRGRKSIKESSLPDNDSATEPAKHSKKSRYLRD